jgi:hypothetical protein
LKKRINSGTAARSQLTAMQLDHLFGRPLPENNFDAWILKYDHDGKTKQLWESHRESVIAEHVKESPGTRPPLWWQHDAPRQAVGTIPGWHCDGQLPELRRRLGGSGEPVSPANLSYGIPDVWRDIDEDDLPIFESQASYLRRHGLLLAGEERRCDFEPESVSPDCDWRRDSVSRKDSTSVLYVNDSGEVTGFGP